MVSMPIREYWMIYRGPGILAVVWFGPSPNPPPPPSVRSTSDIQEDWERETTCWQERGGQEPNLTTGRKPGPLVYHSILSGTNHRERMYTEENPGSTPAAMLFYPPTNSQMSFDTFVFIPCGINHWESIWQRSAVLQVIGSSLAEKLSINTDRNRRISARICNRSLPNFSLNTSFLDGTTTSLIN